MATPEPPDFAEVPNPKMYAPEWKGVTVTSGERGHTVVTRDVDSAASYFKSVRIQQVNNGWAIYRGDLFGGYEPDTWVFTSKADLAKFIVDKF